MNGINADNPTSVWGIVIGSAIAIILPVVLVQIFGFGEDTAKQATDETKAEATPKTENTTSANEETVAAPMNGTILKLSEVPDDVFASGAMGKGVAIQPSEGKLHGPFDGSVVMVAPTKHAIGIRSTTGVELLIHVGLDTVKLDGAPFTLSVKEGDKFKKGDLLMEFDQEAIIQRGIETITPIIVTNTGDFSEVMIEEGTNSSVGQALITAVK